MIPTAPAFLIVNWANPYRGLFILDNLNLPLHNRYNLVLND